jgi:hypothetical protein
LYNGKSQLIPGYVGFVKKFDLGGLVAGTKVGFGQFSSVENIDLIDAGDIVEGVEYWMNDPGVGFLVTLTQCALEARFAVFEKPCRQCPIAVTGFYGPLAK